MTYKYFSQNGKVLLHDKAVVSLDNIEYTYGFGAYETVRVSGGVLYFAQEHVERLLASAQILALDHPFQADFIEASIQELVRKAALDACNLKILLIGAPTKEQAQLYILPLSPLFPERKLYTQGAPLISYQYERILPHAKSLNMLPSYLAYRQARATGAYDALLVNSAGCITEGTRTNVLCFKGTAIISPPEDEILLGVMRKVALKVAIKNGFTLEYQNVPLRDIKQYDAICITSTSSKLMPVRSIDGQDLGPPPDFVKDLGKKVSQFLSECGGTLG